MSATNHVLLVDDDPAFCRQVHDPLVKQGFEVTVARSGPEAIEKARARRGEFGVAIIDQVMGPPNGTETMRRLHEFYPTIETIILTGWGDMEPGEQAMELGAFRYMSKSTQNIDELVLSVRMAARASAERLHSLALEALVPAGERISGAQSDEDLYHCLFEETSRLLPALDVFLIVRHNEATDELTFPFVVIEGVRQTIAPRKSANGLAEFALRHRRPILLAGGDRGFREEHGLDAPTPSLGHCASKIMVPVLPTAQDPEIINAFTYRDDVRYTEEHLEVMQAFANQAAAAKRSIAQFQEAGQLQDASAVLAQHYRCEDVHRAIVEQAHRLIESDFTGLIVQDEDGTLRVAPPVIPAKYAELFDEPRQQAGLTRAVIASGEPYTIPDTASDPLVKDAVREAGIKSMLVMPLSFGGRVLAILYAHTFTPRHFSRHDVRLWRAFASQAGVALHSAQEDERELAGVRRLASGLGSLAEKLDLDQALTRVATVAKNLFAADTCRVAYVDPPTGKIAAWQWADGSNRALRWEEAPRPHGTTNYVLRHRVPVFRSDAAGISEPATVPELLARGLKSFASLPLFQNGRVIAVLHCNYFLRQQVFAERYQRLLEAFGAHAAMALDRARRDRAAEIWHELGRKIATCDQAAGLYETLVDHAKRALQADDAYYLFSRTAESAPDDTLRTGFVHPDGPLPKSFTDLEGVHVGLSWRSLRSGEPVLVVNDARTLDDEIGRMLRDAGIGACLATPVGTRFPEPGYGREWPADWPPGLLLLTFNDATSFESRDLMDLVRACGDTASNLERLRLHERNRHLLGQRTRQLRGITEILTELREQQNSQAILNVIAATAHEALGVDVCSVLSYDAAEGRFTQRGVAGARHPDSGYTLPESFKGWFLDRPGPTVIEDARENDRMRDSEFVAREDVRSLVAFPLKVTNVPLGLFFANARSRGVSFDIETLGLYADLAATVLHQSRLEDALNTHLKKAERRAVWDVVSTIITASRHEESTKASAILNYTRGLQTLVARAPLDDDEKHEFLSRIEETDRLARELANAPAPLPKSFDVERVDIANVLLQTLRKPAWTAPTQSGAAIALSVDLGELEGTHVQGYPQLLTYAFEALFRNARGAMPEGGTTTVTAAVSGPWAEIRVSDTGNGIPERHRSRLFSTNIQKEKDEPGMGIGCLLVDFVAEQHDGTVSLEHTGAQGTTILIRLPLAIS